MHVVLSWSKVWRGASIVGLLGVIAWDLIQTSIYEDLYLFTITGVLIFLDLISKIIAVLWDKYHKKIAKFERRKVRVTLAKTLTLLVMALAFVTFKYQFYLTGGPGLKLAETIYYFAMFFIGFTEVVSIVENLNGLDFFRRMISFVFAKDRVAELKKIAGVKEGAAEKDNGGGQ